MISGPPTDDPDSDTESGPGELFAEPPDFYPSTPPPTTETHSLLSGQTLTLHLVGHNPLWGHHLWQAGRLISNHLEKNPSLVRGRTVLELGAGAGLPSLVCAVLGAKKVVVSDYPDADLIRNLWRNIEGVPAALLPDQKSGEEEGGGDGEKTVVAEGYCWGADVSPLTSHLPPAPAGDAEELRFDVLILADLLFNHSEHGKLVSTIEMTLSKKEDAKALVFFTPYRPWLYEKDMAFFETCRERGFRTEKVLEEKMERVMFEGDPGDEELRRTVFGWVVRWDTGERGTEM